MKDDAAISKLRVTGRRYRRKRLESLPANWESIVNILSDPNLKGVICKITSPVYSLLVHPDYLVAANRLLAGIGSASHMVFVHENTLTRTPPSIEEPPGEDDDDYYSSFLQYHFAPPSEIAHTKVERMFDEHGITVTPYRTNAEISVLATAFIDDNENELLFRIYVPSERLYANEADGLLSMFRRWLSVAGRHAVREEGYATKAGHVYEFFGSGTLTRETLPTAFGEFSTFLAACTDDPSQAVRSLEGRGLSKGQSEQLVARYGKEARRLDLDMRHAREARILTLRQALEAELLDLDHEGFTSSDVDKLIGNLLPQPTLLAPLQLVAPSDHATPRHTVTVNVNQQFIGSVSGSAFQQLNGTSSLSQEATQLLQLVAEFGGDSSIELESSVYELEDPEARHADRMRARQKLKRFLGTLSEGAATVGKDLLTSYLERRLGL